MIKSIIGAVLAVSSVAIPACAWAQCSVAGTWTLKQSNGPTVRVSMAQTGANIVGTAAFGGSNGVIVNGRITGRNLVFNVNWSPRSFGEYNGQINGQGRMTGFTFDRRAPGSQATWVAPSRVFRC